MSDEKRTSQANTTSSDLEDLERRLNAAKKRREKPQAEQDNSGSLLGMAWRLSTELVVAVLVGAAMGYGLDYLLGTRPWFLLIGLGFGIATGLMNTFRIARKMDAQNAHIPIGDDMPETENDELD